MAMTVVMTASEERTGPLVGRAVASVSFFVQHEGCACRKNPAPLLTQEVTLGLAHTDCEIQQKKLLRASFHRHSPVVHVLEYIDGDLSSPGLRKVRVALPPAPLPVRVVHASAATARLGERRDDRVLLILPGPVAGTLALAPPLAPVLPEQNERRLHSFQQVLL